MDDELNLMATLERQIEKRCEEICEKDGWVVSAAISPERKLSLFMEKFSEIPIQSLDETATLERLLAFVKDEFDIEINQDSKQLSKNTETIPNTRAPYHIMYIARIDISDYISKNS